MKKYWKIEGYEGLWTLVHETKNYIRFKQIDCDLTLPKPSIEHPFHPASFDEIHGRPRPPKIKNGEGRGNYQRGVPGLFTIFRSPQGYWCLMFQGEIYPHPTHTDAINSIQYYPNNWDIYLVDPFDKNRSQRENILDGIFKIKKVTEIMTQRLEIVRDTKESTFNDIRNEIILFMNTPSVMFDLIDSYKEDFGGITSDDVKKELKDLLIFGSSVGIRVTTKPLSSAFISQNSVM